MVTNALSRQVYFPTDSTFDFFPPHKRIDFENSLSRIVLRIDSQFIYKTDSPPKTHKGTFFDTDFYSPFLTYISICHKKHKDFYSIFYNKEMKEMVESELRDSRINMQHTEVIETKTNSDGSLISNLILDYTGLTLIDGTEATGYVLTSDSVIGSNI